MNKLTPAAIIAANEVNSETAWLLLLEIILPNEPDEPIRVVQNNEDIQWNDQLWQAFPFKLAELKQDSKGTLSSLAVDVDNTTRDLEYYLQHGMGGANAKVILRCVLSTALEDTTPVFEEFFSVKHTVVTENHVRFTLGNAYSSQARRPYERFMKGHCPFKYKGIKCAATSSEPTCSHTYGDCKARGNAKRFGGFTGIPQGGLYV